jgi:deoxycytidine triphosphate deaminase
MILSDRDIRAKIEAGRIKLQSDNSEVMTQIHASSMDLRLGRYFKIYKHSKYAVLDPKNMDSFEAEILIKKRDARIYL